MTHEYLPPMPEERSLLRKEEEEELRSLRNAQSSWSGMIWDTIQWIFGSTKYEGTKERRESTYSFTGRSSTVPWVEGQMKDTVAVNEKFRELPMLPNSEASSQTWSGSWTSWLPWYPGSSTACEKRAVDPHISTSARIRYEHVPQRSQPPTPSRPPAAPHPYRCTDRSSSPSVAPRFKPLPSAPIWHDRVHSVFQEDLDDWSSAPESAWRIPAGRQEFHGEYH